MFQNNLKKKEIFIYHILNLMFLRVFSPGALINLKNLITL